MTKLNFFTDAAHGWLEVPLDLVKKSGIKVTSFSYIDRVKNLAYLEEDMDAPEFLEALGQEFQVVDVYQCRTFIRDLPRYSID